MKFFEEEAEMVDVTWEHRTKWKLDEFERRICGAGAGCTDGCPARRADAHDGHGGGR